MDWFKNAKNKESGLEGDIPSQNIDDLEQVKAKLKKTKKSSRETFEDRIKEEKLQAEIESLYQAENWEAIASLYFDVRYVTTGYEGFPLTPDQKKRLSTSLATLMRTLPITFAPYYIAGTIFLINFSGVVISKEYQYSMIKEAKAKKEKEREKTLSSV